MTDRIIAEASRLLDAGDNENGYTAASIASRERPEDARAAFLIGRAHLNAGRPETAYYLFRYCQKFKDYDGPVLWNGIATCLADMDRYDLAEPWLLKSLDRGPTKSTHMLIASIYARDGKPEKAVEHAEKALEIDPNFDEAKWNGSLALLKLGEWERGWQWYETALGTKLRPFPKAMRDCGLPEWPGRGGDVLIHAEHGLGDEIMFASVLPDALKDMDHAVLACDPRLITVFERTFGIPCVSRKEKDIRLPFKPSHRIALESLPKFYRNSDASFPGTPFIKADPDRQTMFKALLDSLGDGKKIGVMWKGGVGGLDERWRSLDLRALEPVLSRSGVEWVSLNHLPDAKSECERFYDETGCKVHHWDWIHKGDYENTVALVSQLDAVFAVHGTVAHAAASQGVETHVLVPKNCQWRYGTEGNSIPWYRSMTLYRQTDHWPLEDIPLGVR